MKPLDGNRAALDLELPAVAGARLDAASSLERIHAYTSFVPAFQGLPHGGARVRGWRG